MILLAFDVGRKKTGIAIGNIFTGTARPLSVARGGRTAQLTAIRQHINTWQPAKLVVGLPRHMDGQEHAMTKFSRAFAALLTKTFQLPVEFADERLTTQAARQQNSTDDADSVAAGIILQDWLYQNSSSQSPLTGANS